MSEKNTVLRSSDLRRLVGDMSNLEVVASDLDFCEGPIWNPCDKSLYFSEIAGSRLNRWHPNEGLSVIREPTGMANGNAFDLEGRIVSCEHLYSRVTRREHDGTQSIVADNFEGVELNSPADLAIRSNGTIFFGDPVFGRIRDPLGGKAREAMGSARSPILTFRGIFCVAPDGSLSLATDVCDQPNGICFSADERQLFIADSWKRCIWLFDVTLEGELKNARKFAEHFGNPNGVPDGLKIDSEGNIWCVWTTDGVYVFSPDGGLIGLLSIKEHATSLCFGGKDLNELFITTVHSLLRLQVRVPGLSLYHRDCE
jgi:gluconolactonase